MRLFDRESWAEVAQSLRRHRVRTLLTAFGVAWGMFMLVVMLAFGRGLQAGVLGTLGDYTANSVWIWPGRTNLAHAGHGPGRRVSIDIEDLEPLSRLEGLVALSPRTDPPRPDRRITARRGSHHGSFRLSGEDFDLIRMRPLALDEGRLLNPRDIAKQRKVAALGAQVHEQLFDDHESAVGETIEVSGIEFTIIGVYHARQRGGEEQQDSTIIIPWTTLAHSFGPRDRVGSVALLAEPGSNPELLANEARRLLARRHQVHPDDDMAYEMWSSYRDTRRFLDLFRAIEVLIWIVGGFTLFAGAMGVGNVTLISVRERTREIGVRKALGATTGAIVTQVVLEAMTLTLIAGYLGMVVGVGLIDVVGGLLAAMPADQRPAGLAPPVVDPMTAGLGLAVLCVVGLVASAMPAKAAAAVEPALALQTE
ncbi:MAG: ABC transporter permease [Myxococcota bacterium]